MKWQIGDVTVTKIVELETTGGSRFILPDATPEAVPPISWLIPHFADENGRLKMSIHALLVETPTQRIIVDTCLGNDKQDRRVPTWNDRQGRFLDDLAAAGFAPRDDRHGAVHASARRSRRLEHDAGRRPMGADLPEGALSVRPRRVRALEHADRQRADMLPVFADSVRPIFEAGLADLVERDHRICDEMRLMPSIGHSPGHASVLITSQGPAGA